MSPMAEGTTTRRAAPLWLQIAAAVLAAFLVAAAVIGLALGPRLREIAAHSVDDRIRADLALLSPPVTSELERKDFKALAAIATAAKSTGVRVTVILPDGQVVAESDHPLPLANHLERPEIAEALKTGSGRSTRRSTTV